MGWVHSSGAPSLSTTFWWTGSAGCLIFLTSLVAVYSSI